MRLWCCTFGIAGGLEEAAEEGKGVGLRKTAFVARRSSVKI